MLFQFAKPHNVPYGSIHFIMFKDEIKRKLDVKSEVLPFVVTMTDGKTVISGVKKVMSAKEDAFAVRVQSCVLKISGNGLQIAEMGGGDVYIKGEVTGVEIEKYSHKKENAKK